jgi:hypothetical protein
MGTALPLAGMCEIALDSNVSVQNKKPVGVSGTL